MKLYINTKDRKVIAVTIKKGAETLDTLVDYNDYGSQVLLNLIGKILQQNNFKYQDLTEIEVETGPGSFTGLKIGVAVANTLAFALGIPVNSKNIETNINY